MRGGLEVGRGDGERGDRQTDRQIDKDRDTEREEERERCARTEGQREI